MNLILASGSASRARLLAAAGVPFRVVPAGLDENPLKTQLREAEAPGVATALAEAKAALVSRQEPSSLVIGADQLVEFEGRIINKCHDVAEARRVLAELRGKSHMLHSALVLARGGVVEWRHCSSARLTMRDFSEEFLTSYLAESGEAILSCVGCYQLEGLGAQLFDRIEGDYFSILGLPLLPLLAALRDKGVISR